MSRWGCAAKVLGVTALGCGIVVAAVTVPLRAFDLSPALDLTSAAERAAAAPRRAVVTAATATAVTCPGPETTGVRGSTATEAALTAVRLRAAAAPSTAAPPTAVPPTAVPPPAASPATRAAPGALAAARLPATPRTPTPGPDLQADLQADLRGAAAVVVRGTGSSAVGLTGEQSTLVTRGDLRGLASVTCTAPVADSWLVGGGGDEGRRGRLVLANPAATPVDVRVDVLSADGPVPTTAGSAVAVPARSRVVLLLDALAPGVTAPVVHVRATGGAVAATLHDAALAGTTPRGTDDVAPAAAPARTVLVPGLTINGRALLRIAAPGAAEAVGRVRLLGPAGPVDPPGGAAVRVPAGGTLDVDLGDLPAGTYAAEVSADVPVVAGAMVERSNGAGGPADVAWLAGARPLRTLTGIADVRSGGAWSTTLELSAPGGAATVDLITVAASTVGARGATSTRTLRVPAGSSTLTRLDVTGSAWLRPVTGSAPVVAARTTTYLNRVGADHGRLITAAALNELVTTQVEPVVRPQR